MKKVYFHKTITFWLFFTPLALSCNNFSLKTENVVKNKLNKKYNEKAIALKKSTGCASHSFFERKLKKNGLLFCNKMQLSMKNENMNTSKRILNFLNTLSKEELSRPSALNI